MGVRANLPMPFWNWYTYPNHTGLDWAQPLDTPICAIADGYISFADQWGPRAGGTRTLTIPSLGGLQFMMCHLDDTTKGPPVGSRVRRGDVVAYSGNSGRSTGPHLHGEMWLHGVSQNEFDWFDLDNWIGKNGTPASVGGDPIPHEPLVLTKEKDMILIAQRKNAALAKGRYNPDTGRIREITSSENALLRGAQAAGAGSNVVYSTVSDAAYGKLLRGAK
jgi:murein DD-endopeptidase MepM/ murein hydrolase activator NlpD